MDAHHLVTADHGHLRIYAERRDPGQPTPGLEQVTAMDFPGGKHSYSDRETDTAVRFSNSRPQGAPPGAPGTPAARSGMSTDERLPMKREEERRRVREIAEAIDGFFKLRPNVSWDFAATPDLSHAVVEFLPADVRRRLRRTLPKDLVNHPLESVREHFLAQG